MDSVTCVVGAVGIEKKSTAIKSCKQKRWDRPTKTTVTSVTKNGPGPPRNHRGSKGQSGIVSRRTVTKKACHAGGRGC